MKSFLKYTGIAIWSVFALIGLFLMAGYLAVEYELTNVPGVVDFDSQYLSGPPSELTFAEESANNSSPQAPPKEDFDKRKQYSVFFCSLSALLHHSPQAGAQVLQTYQNTENMKLASAQIAFFRSYVSQETKDELLECDDSNNSNTLDVVVGSPTPASLLPWKNTLEWKTFAAGIKKEKGAIYRVSSETDVPPRIIAAMVVSEQMRLYHSVRQAFKNYFAPLGILGTETKFSLGVTGVKLGTARKIEKHARTPSSPFYPGVGYTKFISYQEGADKDTVRVERLTNTKDHYYSYLYSALFIKEITAQWNNAGYNISRKPGILATLWNIGFTNSTPHANPKMGGSVIQIGGHTYTFGSLAYEFYYSGLLTKTFPYQG